MSRKAWKRVRRQLRPIYTRQAQRARVARKIPRWRISLAAVGFPGFARRWLVSWEKRNAEALAKAMKKTAHFVRGQYHMRPGAPAAPKK